MFGNIDLVTIFLTGLLTGGLTCVAVQGGLLTATLAQREQDHLKKLESGDVKTKHILPILSFLLAKLVAYTALGALLGLFGSLFQLSLTASIILQLAVVIFMVGTALNLLNVHPIFRYFALQPPRFLARFIRQQSKRSDIFAPVVLGLFTVFIPCGVTQAMMALAIASGNVFTGATILFVFILGTSPIFFLLGYFTMILGDVLKKRFTKIAVIALLVIALFNLDGAIALTGFPYTPLILVREGFCLMSYCEDTFLQSGVPVTDQTITITPDGYTPSAFTVRAGSSVTIHLENTNALGCMQAFTIPALNVQKIVAPNQKGTVSFTAPDKPGVISFMCSMGMYAGRINVVE